MSSVPRAGEVGLQDFERLVKASPEGATPMAAALLGYLKWLNRDVADLERRVEEAEERVRHAEEYCHQVQLLVAEAEA